MSGMKAKTIKAVIAKKVSEWVSTIDHESTRMLAQRNAVVTGGCIASMLLGEPVNDFDIYFSDFATTKAVAQYYVNIFCLAHGTIVKVDDADGRVRIVTQSGHRGETVGEKTVTDSGEIEDTYDQTETAALATEDEPPKYRPVFLSTNAITLTGKVQLILRFYGKPDEIHANYDFVHCTNHWTPDGALTLRPEALEALLSKELRYVGSRYPVCSVMRLRKFIARGWRINAGQILKMAMQISDLDMTDPKVLEDQLTGVDSAYFMQVIAAIKEKDAEKVNAAYLVEIIDRMF